MRKALFLVALLILLVACAPRLTTAPEDTVIRYSFGRQLTMIQFNNQTWNFFDAFLVGKDLSFVSFKSLLLVKELTPVERDEIFAELESEKIRKWKKPFTFGRVLDAASLDLDLRVGDWRRNVNIYPAQGKEIWAVNQYLLEEFATWHEPNEEELARLCASLPTDMKADCSRIVDMYRSFKEYQQQASENL